MDERFLSFSATHEELSCFPTDNGNVYNLKAVDYERTSPGRSHEFNSHVKVFIPDGYMGKIVINPNNEDNIEITERVLDGGNWHPLSFTVTYTGEGRPKIYGERELAVLVISKC